MNPLPPWKPSAYHPPALVLHVSLLLEWSFARPIGQYANDVMLKMPRLVSAVPTSWSLQLAEAALTKSRAGQGAPAGSDQCRAWVYSLQIVIDSETPALAWTEILDLARSRAVSIDDAAYLELALRLNLPLATTDATLTRAATAAGVPIFTP